jgi:uncharacterized protein involved in exopolysaccharide biosynthesis
MTDSQTNNFWLMLEVLSRRSRFIAFSVILCSLTAVVVSLVIPERYTATATLLPPKNVTMPMAGVSKLAEVVSVTAGLDLPVMVTPSDLYARILRSHTITGRIIDRFNLYEKLDADNFDEAYELLLDRAEFRVTEEGLLSVSVEDRNAQLAADMANAFVEELNRVNREIVSQRARQNREFIEERLLQVRAELDSARAVFERFQIEHRTVDFDQQTKLASEQAIALKVELATVELELQLSGNTLGESNTELIELRRKRDILSAQLQELEHGSGDSSFFSLPIASIPSLRGRYETLYSRVRVNESLFEALLEQREQARIQENEISPTISVLDPARPPDLRSWPKRTLIVGSTFGSSLILALFLAALMEYFRRLKTADPENYRRAAQFVDAFLGWLPGVRIKK